ncbi:MAG: polysaccharide biosynthesis C-terminal domain-containing protein [Bacilli bacterium]|nr:polysaccharide biosynthesis C-terminal domain-containing protein [Bacilli bacterium]
MPNISKRNNNLIKNTLIFTIGNFASKFLTFFLIPLYTSVLTTSEFGNVDLIFTIITVLAPIFTLNISESVMLFTLDSESNKKDILKIANYFLLLSLIPCIISFIIFNYIPIFNNIEIFVALYLYFLIGNQIFLCALKGQKKVKLYTIGGVLNTFLLIIFNLIFLIIFKLGVKGYFLSQFLSNLIVFIFAFIFSGAFKVNIKSINKLLMKKMIKYSIVLIPTTFMWWIMNSSDRIMVTSMISESANGIYAISYKLPTLISTIIAIFNQAWLFSAIEEKNSDDKVEYTNKIFSLIFSLLFILGVGLMLISKPFMKIYVSNDYYVAWKYMSFLIVGVVFQSLGTFISTSYNVNKDSKGFLFSALLGALINIILNFILIPIIGVYGAACATSMSYISVFAFRLFDTKKYIKIDILKKKYIISFIILLLSALVMYMNFIISEILLLLLFILMFIINKNEINDILKLILNKIYKGGKHGKK